MLNVRSSACTLIVLLLAGSASAQTTFRWKLSEGEKLAIAVTQETMSDVAYSGKKTTTQINLGMHLTWQVLKPAEEGRIRVAQSLDRITFELDSPTAGRVQFDSADQARPSASAREIAAAIKDLMAAKHEITMSDLGEVLSAKTLGADPPAATSKNDAAAPGLSAASVQQLLKQPLVVLPKEAKSIGDTWTTESELASALGPAKQKTTYRYAARLKDEENATLEQIDVKTALELAAKGAALPVLKLHEQTGTVQFDSAAGRVVSAEQSQRLVTERPYRETTIVVTLTSQQKTTVTAVGDPPKPSP
jgi:hypothetical protein